MIVEQSDGCILWDCLSLIDRPAIDYINARGGLKAIALSHPYFYGAMSAWSEAFGGVPAYVHEADREWVMTLKMQLGTCIRDHIKAPEIEEIAKKAVAIGNDYVHFHKYTKHEVHELRGLINLVWRWIELREEIRIENERIAQAVGGRSPQTT